MVFYFVLEICFLSRHFEKMKQIFMVY